VLALLGAAGITSCIALLYQSMAFIMQAEGGFVASGGPYEIAHPAPDWVWLVPVSILAMFLFGGLGVTASLRGWGANPIAYGWSGLFIALGWNFLRLGLAPPEGLQGAWAWMMCGVAFWAMGIAPVVGPISRARARRQYGPNADSGQPRRTLFGLPTVPTTGAYIAAQIIGVAGGIVGAIVLFRAITG
jgi:hypothetical protein